MISKHSPRRCAVALLWLIAFATAGACRTAEPGRTGERERVRAALPVSPGINVVVLSFDALRPDALGIHGYPRPTSRRIDDFAARSLIFDRAYTAAPVTPTSFAAAFSGCLPHRVFRQWKLEAPVVLAEAFATAGYETAAFTSNVQIHPARGFGRGFARYDYDQKASDQVLLDRAAAWFAERRDSRVFAWIHLLTPHAPYRRRNGAAQFYRAGYSGAFIETSGARFEPGSPDDVQRLRDLYDGEVWHADQLFGRFLRGLRRAGMLDRTVVVLTADHGEEFQEHGGVQHGRLHEEHVRIPFIVRHPQVARGSRTSLLTSNVDFAPTLAALAGVPWPDTCEGRNILAAEPPRDRVISVAMTAPRYRAAAILRDGLRLIVTCVRRHRVELYDLGQDARAVTDLVAERPSVARELEAELWAGFGPGGCDVIRAAGGPPSAETEHLPPEAVEALRALGYVR